MHLDKVRRNLDGMQMLTSPQKEASLFKQKHDHRKLLLCKCVNVAKGNLQFEYTMQNDCHPATRKLWSNCESDISALYYVHCEHITGL